MENTNYDYKIHEMSNEMSNEMREIIHEIKNCIKDIKDITKDIKEDMKEIKNTTNYLLEISNKERKEFIESRYIKDVEEDDI